MFRRIIAKIKELIVLLFEEENTWMWSLIAIFALIFTAAILLIAFL